MEVLWAGVGAGLSKLLDLVLDVTAKTMEFKSELNELESILKLLQPVVREIAKLDAELDVPREETEGLTKKLNEGLELVGKCSEIKFYKVYYYSKKIDKYADSLWNFFQIYVQAVLTRDNKKILVLLNEMIAKVDGLDAKVDGLDAKLDELVAKLNESVAKQEEKMKANEAGSSNVDPANHLDTDETEVKSNLRKVGHEKGKKVVESMGVNRKQSWATVSGYIDPNQERWLGLLIINILKGKNLAVRDRIKRSSDPYVVVQMGKQKVKTKVVKRNVNPEWNEALTLCITDTSPPIKLEVYDKDTFSCHDKMGDVDIDIRQLIEATKMPLENPRSRTTLKTRVKPSGDNCLAEESCIFGCDGKVVQYMVLKLQNVECGLVDLQLHWIDTQHSEDAVGEPP